MVRMRYILQNVNVLNGLLILVIAAVSYITILPFLNLNIQMSLPQVKERTLTLGEVPASSHNASPVDYAVISDQNLFHPERKIPPEKKEEKAIPRPEVILYGTLITDDMSIAYLEDKKAPYATPGRGKRQITLKKGDHLSGYVLQQVEANLIVLVKGEDKIVVRLNDGEKRKVIETPTTSAASRTSAGAPQTSAPASHPAVPTSIPAVTLPGTAPGGTDSQAPYDTYRPGRRR